MSWQDAYTREIRRRRWLKHHDFKTFKKLNALNPHGLAKDCKDHVFVPASHLYCLGKGKGAFMMNGLSIVSFRAGWPYRDEGYSVVPQMCINCECTREHQIPLSFYRDRVEAYSDKKKVTYKKKTKVREISQLDWF